MLSKAVYLNWLLVNIVYSIWIFGQSSGDIVEVTPEILDTFVKENRYVLLLFKSAECADCSEAADELEKVVPPETFSDAVVKSLSHNAELATHYGVSEFPKLVFFRQGTPVLYDGEKIVSSEVSAWLGLAEQEAVQILTDDTFEHLTQAATGATTGDWFVLFFKPSCPKCQQVFPAFESVAVRVKQRMNFATVDMETNKKLLERFKIEKCPTAILFRQGKMYEYEPEKYEPKAITSFVESWYTNVQAKPVPVEPTAFDRLTESIAMALKEQLHDPNRKWIILSGAISVAIVTIVIIAICACKKSPEGKKKQE
ncbi:hypothetical protein CHS0354_037263 [Potamilus streckersoni]|uniref:Thioredoxin domain-containing protein n=1 Tax=Potamilus streckersoni TaxID=2493646 RepID=A0AAE0W441_9BIVA|nr:hypothetical protein CHS0354_037263 [Potamilus streckersoni]